MKQQKSFWKKYEFLIIAVITIVIIYLIVVFNQKINFLLGNEMIVYLRPQQKSFSLHYGEISKANFDVTIDNAAYCEAECSYSFNDRSKNEVIDKGDFKIEKRQHFMKSYNILVKRLGSGQDIYSFDVKCRSIHSFFCLTKSAEKSRSSLITVNYDLTETEKKLKEILKKNVTMLLELLNYTDALHQQINQEHFELGFKVNLQNLSKQKISIDDSYDKIRISIENLRSIWAVENYAKLNQLFNMSFFEALNHIKNSIASLSEGIDNIVELHNSLLIQLNFLSNNLKELENFVGILRNNNALSNMDISIQNFNKFASSITNNTFDNYTGAVEELAKIEGQQSLIIQEYRIPSAELFFDSEYLLKFENDLLCSLKQDCMENISATSQIKSTEQFLKNYPNAAALRQNCNRLEGLGQKFLDIRNESSRIIADKNITFPSTDEFLMLADSFKDNEIRKINNSYHESFEKLVSENKTTPEVIGIAESILPKSKTNITNIDYNQSLNISLYLLSKINLSDDASLLLGRCNKLDNYTEKIGNFDFEPIKTSINYTIISKIDTNLSDNQPICCIFNECKPCCRDESCRNDPKTFPIILLHGHSLAKDNSPEFSLDSFNKLQSKLQDDGYLNAGIVSLYSQNEQLQQGLWGLSGKPVTVKVSYYYDAFKKEDKYIAMPTKSENIDAYSLRLRDLIWIVKQRTGKPKVNIIAHSMGGLVARRYVQIFGGNDIDKLIMIATPNKGISAETSNYCGYVGENRECEDMQESSLFINKLNDPLKKPTDVKLYTIIGQGCKMKVDERARGELSHVTGDGDGIVLSESVQLENAKAYFVNGTCGGIFGESLHTEILNIDQYNETYKIVAEILKE